MNDFTRAYLECAIWTGTDESDESGGEPLDRNYGIEDFSPEALARAEEDCARFQEENPADLTAFAEIWPESPDGSSAAAFQGYNLWLSRNGHGTGFWDRYAGEVGERLHAAAEKMRECWVYVGDDGKLYLA